MLAEPQSTGEFLCPSCGVVRPFAIRRISDTLTKYAVPLWSSDQGRYVECLECGEAFHPSVLNSPSEMTDEDFAAFRSLMVGVMVSMMDIDGLAHQQELDAIHAIYRDLAGGPVHDSVMAEGIELARLTGTGGAIALAIDHNPRLNQLSRELVFRAALYISAADGRILQEEMDFLGDLGKALGLDAEHMHAIIESALDEGHISIGGRA